MGRTKTVDKIKQRYYWPNQYIFIAKQVSTHIDLLLPSHACRLLLGTACMHVHMNLTMGFLEHLRKSIHVGYLAFSFVPMVSEIGVAVPSHVFIQQPVPGLFDLMHALITMHFYDTLPIKYFRKHFQWHSYAPLILCMGMQGEGRPWGQGMQSFNLSLRCPGACMWTAAALDCMDWMRRAPTSMWTCSWNFQDKELSFGSDGSDSMSACSACLSL